VFQRIILDAFPAISKSRQAQYSNKNLDTVNFANYSMQVRKDQHATPACQFQV
jgi:hypothetical protein